MQRVMQSLNKIVLSLPIVEKMPHVEAHMRCHDDATARPGRYHEEKETPEEGLHMLNIVTRVDEDK